MKEASKVKQTNKVKQHSTPKAVTFPKKKVYIIIKSLWMSRACAPAQDRKRQRGSPDTQVMSESCGISF